MDSILDCIQAFLRFVANPPADTDERAQGLERHLDHLAWVRHLADHEFDDRDLPEPPARRYLEDRAILAERFPELGPFVGANIFLEDGQAEVMVRDALDDLTDLCADMEEFSWRWENNSRADALFYLRLLGPHWMGHLRGLQQHRGAVTLADADVISLQ